MLSTLVIEVSFCIAQESMGRCITDQSAENKRLSAQP